MLLEDGDRTFMVFLSNGQVVTCKAHNTVHAKTVAINDYVRPKERAGCTVRKLFEVFDDNFVFNVVFVRDGYSAIQTVDAKTVDEAIVLFRRVHPTLLIVRVELSCG